MKRAQPAQADGPSRKPKRAWPVVPGFAALQDLFEGSFYGASTQAAHALRCLVDCGGKADLQEVQAYLADKGLELSERQIQCQMMSDVRRNVGNGWTLSTLRPDGKYALVAPSADAHRAMLALGRPEEAGRVLARAHVAALIAAGTLPHPVPTQPLRAPQAVVAAIVHSDEPPAWLGPPPIV